MTIHFQSLIIKIYYYNYTFNCYLQYYYYDTNDCIYSILYLRLIVRVMHAVYESALMLIPLVAQSTDDGNPCELVPGCILQSLRLEDRSELVPGLSTMVSENPPGPDTIQPAHYCEEVGNEDSGISLYCKYCSNYHAEYTNCDSMSDFPVDDHVSLYGAHLPDLHGDYHVLNFPSPETSSKGSSWTTECVMITNTPQLQTDPEDYREKNNDCG